MSTTACVGGAGEARTRPSVNGWSRDEAPRVHRRLQPRTATLELHAQVERVLGTYEAELPLTARQVFYRLVATVGYEKNENAYARLQEHLANFRRAGIVDFSAIRDDGTIVEQPLEYGSPDEFLRIAEGLAREGQGVRLAGQPQWVEVWCEAAGMAPQLARAVGEYGVTVFSSGGFDSLTVKYEAAQRILARDVPTVVLHVGDLILQGWRCFKRRQRTSRRLPDTTP